MDATIFEFNRCEQKHIRCGTEMVHVYVSDMRAAVACVVLLQRGHVCETLNNNRVCGKLNLNLIVRNVAPDCRRRCATHTHTQSAP